MNLVSIDNISKSMGNKKLFENISFGIDESSKTALIGINGCGKSTLLKIISKIENIDSGNITYNNKIQISYLEQIPKFNPEDTILQHIFNFNSPLGNLIKKYEQLCYELDKNNSESIQKELHEVTDEINKKNAWDYEHKIKSILSELEINDLSIKMKNLSGGMLKKVAIAQCMINESNLLIMDEPTNHLDLQTITFLENFLIKTTKAVLLVTHDRYLLDNICNSIIEIEHNGIYRYEGNYSYYLEKKAEIENSLLKDDERTETILRKELEWYKRQPKARTTKSKSRMENIESMMSREKLKYQGDMELTISGRRLGKKILEINEISKSFNNNPVINSFSYIFKQNEKIGIIGPNGSGKTTLLNILNGLIKPDKGTIDKGINTELGYFTQIKEELNPDMRIIDYIKNKAEVITLDNGVTISASKMLERFLFNSSMQYNTIANLSGGERRRLYLLNILMGNPNFIILDEPTNDFDIKSLGILENFLNDFNGCLIIVSHDRYFMNRVVDHLLVFDNKGNIESFPGNYTDYLDYLDFKKNVTPTIQKENIKNIKDKETSNKTKLTFKEKKELEELEMKIENLENEKKEIDKFFSEPNFDNDKTQFFNKRYIEIETKLEELIKRWEYLAGFES